MNHQTGGYDAFASEAFAPFYPLYAQAIIERTGVRDGQLLDLGSGGGHLGFALMDVGRFERVTFADISAAQLEKARTRAAARGYTPDECAFVETDAVCLKAFATDSFDLVVSRGSLQFWSDQLTALREIHRVLKPGGYAYLGGGIGTNYRLTKRIEGLMDATKQKHHVEGGPRGKSEESGRRKGTRHENCRAYMDLFEELGCSYAVMNSKSEGGWYIFCKDDHLEW